MNNANQSDLLDITEELYKKNLDLVNANKEHALVQTLYEITIHSQVISDITQQYINTITRDLGFIGGSVWLINKAAQTLELSAATDNLQQEIVKHYHFSPQSTSIDLTANNPLCASIKSGHRLSRRHLCEFLRPLDSMSLFDGAVKSTIIIPLKVDKKNLGIFTIFLDKTLDHVPKFEQNMLKHVSVIFGIAIDRIMLVQDLKKANRNLRHLDKLKDEFVFIATHELKNPVTAMRGYLSMLQEGSFGAIPEKMQDPFSQLQSSNQQLVELVNDLLQIARAEAKTITINTSPVKLCEIAEVVLESVKPLAEQKGLSLKHECPNQNLKVLSDENRLKEILNNLVSNAIKYSDKGTVTISYELKDSDVITHVADNGVGIPDKDQDHIFTRFFRVEEEAAKGIPGTGLGLFIVKQLIEKMGGKIWFDSSYGQGTTFSFSLPACRAT